MSIRHARISVPPRTILGYRPDGRPIYPIAGGSGEGDAPAEGADGAADTEPEAPADGKETTPPAETSDGDKPDGEQTFDAAYVRKLRDEAASHRTEKQASRDALAQIAKILNPDAEKPDATEIPQQLAQAQAESVATARELAIYKAANKNGADPDKLVDSRSFMDSVKNLDPAADDFKSKVADAIKEAVKTNTGLAAAQAAPPQKDSTVDHSGGSGEGKSKPTDLSGAVAARYANA